MNPDPQHLATSSLPVDRVYGLERGELFHLAGRPRTLTPKRGRAAGRAALRLVPAPDESSQSAPSTKESR